MESIMSHCRKMLELRNILSKYDNFLFISPHLDDAVLSCGQLLLNLGKKNKKVTVITIFTKGESKTTSPQAKTFLKNCNYKNAADLYKDFNNEDIRVLKFLGAKYIHMGYTDAAWRIDSLGKPIYTDSKSQFSGTVSPKDSDLAKKITTKLITILKDCDNETLILAPLAIGGHADHVIARNIVKNIRLPKIFWEDFPYNTDRISMKKYFSSVKSFKRLFIQYSFNNTRKDKSIKFYKSQMKSLFPTGKIYHTKESYYFLNKSKLY